MSKTLLEVAKSRKRKKKAYSSYTEEEYELALAHIRGDVTFLDVKAAMKYRNLNSVYTLMYNSFKRYYKETNQK